MEGAVILIPIIGTIMLLSTVIFVVGAFPHAKTRKAPLQADVHTRLIDKFSNAPEFVDFLNSETGKQFLSGIDKMPKLMARDRIVGGVSRGLILTLLGVAFVGIWIADSNIGFMFPGFILLGLGIAFFLSTLVSLKLSQKFGLIGDDSPTPREVGHANGRREPTETEA